MPRTPDYTQTISYGWDTIGDIFHDELILESLREFIEFTQFWKWDTQGLTEGDLLYLIMNDTDKFEEFLQILRNNPIFETDDFPKIVTLILAINHVRDALENTPQSVIWIFGDRIQTVLSQAKEITYWSWDTTQDDIFSYFQGLDILSANNRFPLISSEWEVVYYHSQVAWSDELINVWTQRGTVLTMDRKGEIVWERDDSFEHQARTTPSKFQLIEGWAQNVRKRKRKWKPRILRKGDALTHPRFKAHEKDTGKK